MNEKSLFKSAMVTLVIVVCVVLGYELYLRNQGISVDYDDGPPLWADKRAQIYGPTDKTIVFIGSSRIKYDLDRATWRKLTTTLPVQLAMEGTCPRPVLTDLANDPNFKGKLVIDVTEGLFFNMAPPFMETANENIKYYYDRTPAQRASFELNKVLESKFAFLDKDFLSTNARLEALQIPSRPGVFMMPTFPMNFKRNTFGRQAYMTNSFVANEAERNQVKAIWGFFAKMAMSAPPMPPAAFDAIFKSVKADIDKIKARGGEVVFVRTPSSGVYLQGENMGFPREKFWNRLLAETKCPGIHFMDYPAIAHFDCPELSHLKKADAKLFTKEFFRLLSQQPGFTFLQNTNPKKL
ncbi:hypothetical protein [Flavobacterium phycosphaerae]|uniref:hypothetical protein n=1 Tax=Flavobacterium phycosphaerae TaxID=2697515 RepID=UPI00138B095F|nr:hypothetical protein [Flavobacterium phycosphaerae]